MSLVSIVFILFMSYHANPDLRETYPYAGYSTLGDEYWEHYGEDRTLSDGVTGLDALELFHEITYFWLVARKDIAMTGKFLYELCLSAWFGKKK